MKEPEIVATIADDYTLAFSVPRLLVAKLASVGKGKKVKVGISLYRKKSTRPQYGYLFGVVYPMILQYIMEKTGEKFSCEDLHERYKRQLLGYEQSTMVKGLIKVKSTKDMDSDKFWDEFIERVCHEWSLNGLYIPLPKKEYENENAMS